MLLYLLLYFIHIFLVFTCSVHLDAISPQALIGCSNLLDVLGFCFVLFYMTPTIDGYSDGILIWWNISDLHPINMIYGPWYWLWIPGWGPTWQDLPLEGSSSLLFHYTHYGKVPNHLSEVRTGELCSTSVRAKFLHRLLGIVVCNLPSAHTFTPTLNYVNVDSWLCFWCLE